MTHNEQLGRLSLQVTRETLLRIALALGIFTSLLGVVHAEVVRMEIRQRASFADGHRFGAAGPYERIAGRMVVEVDPDDPANARIHDLKLRHAINKGALNAGPTSSCSHRPIPGAATGVFCTTSTIAAISWRLWTFNNAEGSNDPSTMDHAGNGFLFNQGYSILWSGWNGEVVEDGKQRLLAGLPIATADGQTITGPAHLEIATTEKVFSRAFSWSPWGISDAFPTVSLDTRQAKLTMRASREEPAIDIPHTEWAFARLEDGKLIPDPTHVYVKDGFRPGWLYDLVYTAQKPRVTGLGMAACAIAWPSSVTPGRIATVWPIRWPERSSRRTFLAFRSRAG